MPTSSPRASTSTKQARPRPRGLWKGRNVTIKPCHAPPPHPESETDDDEHRSVSKRARYTPSENTSPSVSDDEDDVYYWDYSRQFTISPKPERVSGWTRRTKIMDTTTTAHRGAQTNARTTCDLEDWEDLKDLFGRAAEQYEGDDISEALPLLRGVVHECHRFLLRYEDPSVLFANPPRPPEPTPFEDRLKRDVIIKEPTITRRKCKCIELPTAFHAILGTALFLFGNLIAQDPSLALPDEPNTPLPYWLAALDVFETGENLPSRTSGRGCDAPEDWRMAIVWGRTLVCIADATVTRQQELAESTGDAGKNPQLTVVGAFSADEPDWPPESPFSAIVARRPPLTRMSLSSASPNELMVLAMDQFSRGIFHMPHPQHQPLPPLHTPSIPFIPPPVKQDPLPVLPPLPPLELPKPSSPPPLAPDCQSFSRPKELFTIASEVLSLAERLPISSERQYWAKWADSVFEQMRMEADMDLWRGMIMRARGRAWLIVGSARAEAIEDAMEVESDSSASHVLASEEAEDAREGLAKAVEFLERARGSAKREDGGEEAEQDVEDRKLLAEAVLTLANLTAEEGKREELYAHAKMLDLNLVGLDDEEEMDIDV